MFHNYDIYHGDCLDFLKKSKDEIFKLIVTSPPYNLGKSYEQKKSINEYLKVQKPVIIECIRVLKKSGSICWQVGNFVENGENHTFRYFSL